MKFRIILFCLLAVRTLSFPLTVTEWTPAETVQKFKEALKTVDRLVLIRTDFDRPKDKNQEKVVLEIKGTDVITTLGDTLEIKQFDMECLCDESPEMHFYQGDTYRFSMTLHHSHRLRGRDAVWGGDAVLTEQSAERFRTWFAAHGYDGFMKAYTEMLKAMAEDKAQKDAFLAIFPEPVRSMFPNEKERFDQKAKRQKIIQITNQYTDHAKLVLDCWRGLGEVKDSYRQGWEREWADFLRDILNSLEVKNLQTALAGIPTNENRVWIGAVQYYQQPGIREKDRLVQVFSEEWLARLAKRVLTQIDKSEQVWIIQSLAERPAPATNQLLLEIAAADPLVLTIADRNSEMPSISTMSIAVQAILALSKKQVTDCRPILLRRLSEVVDPEMKLVLEVALAQFDGPGAIKPAHFQSRIPEVVKMAWDMISKDPKAKISIETLAMLAASSDNYLISDAVAEKLQAYGLRTLSKAEKAAAILNEPCFKNAQSMGEIEALIAEYKQAIGNRRADETERRVLAVLNNRKGRLLLRAGDFEQAASSLMGEYFGSDIYADHAFASQALGRFDDAVVSINCSVDHHDEEAAAKKLVRRGYLAFAMGAFEDAMKNFTASETIGSFSRDEGPLTLIQYLCGLLSGKQTDLPTSQYMFISDSGKFETGEPDLNQVNWPESGSFYLRGKLTEVDVFARIEKNDWKKEKNLCEAHFVFSALCRAKGDTVGEMKHLEAALTTKAFTNQCFSLATVRKRELLAKAMIAPVAVPVSH